MFEDNLIPLEQEDVIAEAMEIHLKAKQLTDEELMDEVTFIIAQEDFAKETEYHIQRFFNSGKLEGRARESLEGCYTLWYTPLMVGDNGKVYVMSKGMIEEQS